MKFTTNSKTALKVSLCTLLFTLWFGSMAVMAGSTPQTADAVNLNVRNTCIGNETGTPQYFSFQTTDTIYYSFTMRNPSASSVSYTVYRGNDALDGNIAINRKTINAAGSEASSVILPKNTTCLIRIENVKQGAETSFQIVPIPDDYGNTFSEATPIGMGATVTGNIEVAGLKESDFFCFTTTNNDSYYQLTTAGTHAENSIYTYLYNGTDETYKVKDYYAGSSQTTSGLYKLEKNKTYYVKFQNTGDYQSSYRFSVKEVKDNAGDDFAAAKALTVNKSVNGKFEISEDVDFFRFKTNKKKKAYQLSLKNKSNGTMRVTVYYNDDVASRLSKVDNYYVGSASTATIQIDLQKSHTYYVKVYGGTSAAQYTLSVKDCQTAIKKDKPAQFKLAKTDAFWGRYSRLSWDNNDGYDGVELYRSTSKNKGYKKIATVKNGTESYYDRSVKKNRTYYYKARYYVTDNGKKYYGKWTSIKRTKFS